MAEKYLTENPALAIDMAVSQLEAPSVVVVTDRNVEKEVVPLLADSEVVKNSPHVAITPGEEGKTLDTVVEIWKTMEQAGATRKSVVLNIGGGVVTDIGGFAAATFKRGVPTINFPTTLLGAVDAATGGKTGINFNGLKNEIGAFHQPSKVIISPIPFSTLPQREILSGYAEMIKTALISDRRFYVELSDLGAMVNSPRRLGKAVEKCVGIKEMIVAQDPLEKGLRKILNFGHTAGHGFESLRIDRGKEVTHGEAVAHGMLVALILSHIQLGFSSRELNLYRSFLKENYPLPMISCQDIPEVIERINHDKKNSRPGEPSFTLLKEIGEPEIDCKISLNDLQECLDIYVEMTE